MAEVLITLGIIGVIAALTMPNLIAKYQVKETVAKLKKMHSVLSQAYTMYLLDNNSVSFSYTPEGAANAYNIFKPYLKVAKECGTGDTTGKCFSSVNYKQKSGNPTLNYSSTNLYYQVLLNDGSSIQFRGANDVSSYDIIVQYDINGAKGPNRWGYDLFEFLIKGDKIFPAGLVVDGIDLLSFDNACAQADAYGDGCTAWVIYKENMDYLHCDDLTWNGKSKCN